MFTTLAYTSDQEEPLHPNGGEAIIISEMWATKVRENFNLEYVWLSIQVAMKFETSGTPQAFLEINTTDV